MDMGRYWIALFNAGGNGVERELSRCDQIQQAWTHYKQLAAEYPDRMVMLCDRATMLARSDRRISSAAA
jgi:hypothetical protein